MSAVVTDSMREWASAFVLSVQNVAEMQGVELTPEYVDRITTEIRAAFTTLRRYDPADEVEFWADEGDQDVSGGLADRAAAKEWWQATGGGQG